MSWETCLLAANSACSVIYTYGSGGYPRPSHAFHTGFYTYVTLSYSKIYHISCIILCVNSPLLPTNIFHVLLLIFRTFSTCASVYSQYLRVLTVLVGAASRSSYPTRQASVRRAVVQDALAIRRHASFASSQSRVRDVAEKSNRRYIQLVEA